VANINIVFRVDSSLKIGSGHLIRCLTLANQLSTKGAKILFICSKFDGVMVDLISKYGYQYKLIDHSSEKNISQINDATQTVSHVQKFFNDSTSWMIVDHYRINIEWHRYIKKYIKKLMVIDDLADRQHYCDALLNQNYYENIDSLYSDLIPNECKLLLGLDYVMLDPQFLSFRNKIQSRIRENKRLLIYFGATDSQNLTTLIVEILLGFNLQNLEMDVVLGSNNQNKYQINKLSSIHSNINIHDSLPSLAKLIYDADYGIGACGATTWERLCLNLPSFILSIADNQHEMAKSISDFSMIVYGGKAINLKHEHLKKNLYKFITSNETNDNLHNKKCIIDAKGTSRVVNFLTDRNN